VFARSGTFLELLICETEPVTERLRVREIDDGEGRLSAATESGLWPARNLAYHSPVPVIIVP
jgi:hypothetical protein